MHTRVYSFCGREGTCWKINQKVANICGLSVKWKVWMWNLQLHQPSLNQPLMSNTMDQVTFILASLCMDVMYLEEHWETGSLKCSVSETSIYSKSVFISLDKCIQERAILAAGLQYHFTQQLAPMEISSCLWIGQKYLHEFPCSRAFQHWRRAQKGRRGQQLQKARIGNTLKYYNPLYNRSLNHPCTHHQNINCCYNSQQWCLDKRKQYKSGGNLLE